MAHPIEVAGAMVQAINRHDVPELAGLLTEDHELIDALDNAVRGREAVAAAWEMYFGIVADYHLEVESVFARDSTAALFGRARGRTGIGADADWDIPWACQVATRGERVACWRIYCDNEPARRSLAASARTTMAPPAHG